MKKILLLTKILTLLLVFNSFANTRLHDNDTLVVEEIEKAAALKITNVSFDKISISLKDEYSFWENKESPSVFLVQSTRDAAFVLSSKKNSKHITLKVEDGKLILKKDKEFHISDPDDLIIFIETKNLSEFKVDGIAEIETLKPIKSEKLEIALNGFFDMKLNLNVDVLLVEINGIFDVKLKGTAREANFEVSGIGEFNSSKFIVENLNSAVSGIGDASFYATQSAQTSASGLGNISIKGNPKVLKKNVSGIGSVNY